MDKTVRIPIPESRNSRITRVIHGSLVLRVAAERPVLVIFVHGFRGHRNESLFVETSRRLHEAGISSFRFDAYGMDDDQRKFDDYSIEDHAYDLETAIDYFKSRDVGFSETPLILVVGHCMGGTVALSADDTRLDGVVLLDMGPLAHPLFASYTERVSDHLTKVNWEVPFVVTDELIGRVNYVDLEGLVTRFRKPLFVITSDTSNVETFNDLFLRAAHIEKRIFAIEQSGHWFNSDAAVREVAERISFAAERITAISMLRRILDSEAIEDYVPQVLEILARRAEVIHGRPGVLTDVHSAFGRLWHAHQEADEVEVSALDVIMTERDELRADLRSRLERFTVRGDVEELSKPDALFAQFRNIQGLSRAIERVAAEIAGARSAFERRIARRLVEAAFELDDSERHMLLRALAGGTEDALDLLAQPEFPASRSGGHAVTDLMEFVAARQFARAS